MEIAFVCLFVSHVIWVIIISVREIVWRDRVENLNRELQTAKRAISANDSNADEEDLKRVFTQWAAGSLDCELSCVEMLEGKLPKEFISFLRQVSHSPDLCNTIVTGNIKDNLTVKEISLGTNQVRFDANQSMYTSNSKAPVPWKIAYGPRDIIWYLIDSKGNLLTSYQYDVGNSVDRALLEFLRHSAIRIATFPKSK